MAAIKKAGGSVAYDWEWGTYNPDIVDHNGKPRAPKWLANSHGRGLCRQRHSCEPGASRWPNDRNRANDETLAHIGRLGRLEYLVLNGTAVTDAGLAHLEGLTGLRGLELWHTQIGDTGLAHLKGMSNLRLMNLAETRVTDDGRFGAGKGVAQAVDSTRRGIWPFLENVTS